MSQYKPLEVSLKFGEWLSEAMEEFASKNNLFAEPYHQDEPVFYLKGEECRCYPGAVHYHKVVQITAFDTAEGEALCFIPHHNKAGKAGIVKEDLRKLERLVEQNKMTRFKNLVRKALNKAWENESS